MLHLKIDTHERAMIPLIRDYLRVNKKHRIKEFKVEVLQAGDYATSDGFIGIERKDTDFMSSLYSNLKQQLKELRDNYERPYIFIEYGGPDDLINSFNAPIGTITGAMAMMISHCHVPPIFTGSYFVPILFKTIDKAYDGKDIDFDTEYTPLRSVATKKQFNYHIIESAFHGLGISSVLAKRLQTHFETPQAIFNASIEDLIEVEGIGKLKAKKMYDAVRSTGKIIK